MIKFLGNTGSTIALLLFLALIGTDCLHCYALPLSSKMHRYLFAAMVVLSSLSCLLLLRNFRGIRRTWEKTILKLASASAETENKFEAGVRYAFLSVASALCFYTFAVVWGLIYLSNGPTIRTGYVALSVFFAYNVTAVVAAFKFERIKRSMKSKRAKAKPGEPAA